MKKVRLGVRAADVVALVFLPLGAAFCAVALVSSQHLDAFHVEGNASAAMFPLIFGGIGAPFLLIGLLLAVFSLRKRRILRRVVANGDYVMADVAQIRPNFSIRVNGQSPYVLECHYRDPATGTLHVFKSRNLFYCPVEMENRQIRVYVDRDDLRRYYVDVESLVPDVEIH